MFTPEVFLDDLLTCFPFPSTQPVLQLTTKQHATIRIMLHLIDKMIEEKSDRTLELASSQTHTLLLFLAGVFSNSITYDKSALPPVLVAFKNLVQQQFRQHVNVNGYAYQLHISPKHLIDLCKKHIGKTPLRLIHECTVAEAKRLLFSTRFSIKEVASELNFDDPAYFTKYFKSVCRFSPIEYRRTRK